MKILHLLQSPHFSGAENVVCQIIGLFNSDKHIEMVYCSQEGPIRNALNDRKIRFEALPAFTLKEVKKIIAKEKPDLIHAHDMRASLYCSLVCGNIPFVSHIHNNALDARGVSLKSFAYIYAGLKAKHIFWVSRSAFEGYAFNKIIKKKSSVLYNIIDVDALYERMKEDQNTYDYDLIFLGRLTEPKNPLRLVKVFKLLKDQKSDVKIAVVGTGDLEQEVKDEVNRLQLTDNVDFLGYQSNPLKILHDSKIMIMTSIWEGTPMCALEAMGLGVPIVSTPVDGLKDIIRNDVNGYLSDEDQVLANKIIEYINDLNLRSNLSNSQKEKSVEWNDKEKYKSEISKAYGLE
jgi:glycosyltransferase involved in cell wall biosynthesis